MLTIEEARKVDPSLNDLSDEEFAEALDVINNLADLALNWALSHPRGSKESDGFLDKTDGEGTLEE
jgi:hypothetical protein